VYVTEGWVIVQKCHILSIEMQSGTTFNNLSSSATFFQQLQSNTTFNLSLPATFYLQLLYIIMVIYICSLKYFFLTFSCQCQKCPDILKSFYLRIYKVGLEIINCVFVVVCFVVVFTYLHIEGKRLLSSSTKTN